MLEDGKTYQENAEKKARAFWEVYRTPVLADDSGLEIDILNGEPGLFSARFGGENLKWNERWDYLYGRLAGFSQAWNARFRAVLCYFSPTSGVKFFEGVTEGRISSEPRGRNGFGYDPVFYSTELQKTFGEATDAEKANVSHRARASQEFLRWAEKNLS